MTPQHSQYHIDVKYKIAILLCHFIDEKYCHKSIVKGMKAEFRDKVIIWFVISIVRIIVDVDMDLKRKEKEIILNLLLTNKPAQHFIEIIFLIL